MDLKPMIRRSYFVGVDLGQVHDPTAIAVMERVWDHGKTRHELRHLERLPLGSPYPAQVAYVGELLTRAPLSERKTTLVIDHTGVGRPVFDMFKRGRLRPVGLTLTAGESSSYTADGWRVSKVQLMSRLQATLHSGELRIAAGLKDAQTLVRELMEFRATFSAAGSALFGAREGAHDDLVLATAIALWVAATKREVVSRPLQL